MQVPRLIPRKVRAVQSVRGRHCWHVRPEQDGDVLHARPNDCFCVQLHADAQTYARWDTLVRATPPLTHTSYSLCTLRVAVALLPSYWQSALPPICCHCRCRRPALAVANGKADPCRCSGSHGRQRRPRVPAGVADIQGQRNLAQSTMDAVSDGGRHG